MDALEEQLDRAPHDEAAFLIYADALLERGNPHGELIRVQQALAQRPDDAELQGRDIQLRKKLMPGLARLGAYTWKLGFPRSLELRWIDDQSFGELATLLRSRLCRFIEAVELADYSVGQRVVDLLETLPHLSAISIDNNLEVLSSPNAQHLLEAVGRMKGLKRLRLKTNSATTLLSALPPFPSLARLTLSGTRLRDEDVTVLKLARGRLGEGCELRLSGGTCPLATEPRIMQVWPFIADDTRRPGLLVEAPARHRGCWLLSTGRPQRIGLHVGCDLELDAVPGLRPVHAVFEGTTLRDAGDLSIPPKQLFNTDRLRLGEAVLRYCDDVFAQREALKSTG